VGEVWCLAAEHSILTSVYTLGTPSLKANFERELAGKPISLKVSGHMRPWIQVRQWKGKNFTIQPYDLLASRQTFTPHTQSHPLYLAAGMLLHSKVSMTRREVQTSTSSNLCLNGALVSLKA
jgi:hypothetical protein